MRKSLYEIAATLNTPVERRLFAEYGAIFLTEAVAPPRIVFADAAEVEAFQATLDIASNRFGEHLIELQAPAMAALEAAAREAEGMGLTITARAADSGRRSYEDTVGLWNRNVTRGLAHWVEEERLEAERAAAIGALPAVEQVAVILEMEEREELYFGTFFDKSILYSVAAPGASQHLSLLAFDVAEFENPTIAEVLARHGWHRTVVNDFPHFTFLGLRTDDLAGLPLVQAVRIYNGCSYAFWIPDRAALFDRADFD